MYKPRYLAAALIAILLALLALVNLLWGWWQLEQSVTLSPIETARAFGAPALQTSRANATINDILREIGENNFTANEGRATGQTEDFGQKLPLGTPRNKKNTDGEGDIGPEIVVTECRVAGEDSFDTEKH